MEIPSHYLMLLRALGFDFIQKMFYRVSGRHCIKDKLNMVLPCWALIIKRRRKTHTQRGTVIITSSCRAWVGVQTDLE